MTACNQPDCPGTVAVTGFCDTCGRQPKQRSPAGRASGEASGASGSNAAREPSGTGNSQAGQGVHDNLGSLPFLRPPNPLSLVVHDHKPPETGRQCGTRSCTAMIGIGHEGQPPLSKGYCPECRAFFSFEPQLQPGEVVSGRYRVIGCLTHGGLGWIYLAKDTHLADSYVALKGLINPNDEEARRKLVHTERYFLTRLHHRNIIRIFDFVTHRVPDSGETADSVKTTDYIVMEYAGGKSLREVINMAKRGQSPFGVPLRLEYVIGYGLKILDAFDYLHNFDQPTGEGLLYCDMKPDNVIHGENQIKIIDLGGINDRTSQHVGTEWYQVPEKEIEKHGGPTVRSDIYTVGKTLKELFDASADRAGQTADSPIGPGVRSFLHVIARATHRDDPERRFATAKEMYEQLRGVLREVLSLRDGQERPERSKVFAPAVKVKLLDDGLGAAPPLEHWIASRDDTTDETDIPRGGRPPMPTVAMGLPIPIVDARDRAKDFLADVNKIDDPRKLIHKLREFKPGTVETALHGCRAHIEVADLDTAAARLSDAEDRLGDDAPRDWRVAWHQGLLALARNDAKAAEHAFARVYGDVPGEDAPKLALGFCAEQLGDPGLAEDFYEAVWRRDRTQVNAAFGLARIRLSNRDRAEAAAILDEVPQVSPHYEAAKIAAIRVHCARLVPGSDSDSGLPTVADFLEVDRRLRELYSGADDDDHDSREGVTAVVWKTALTWVCETGGSDWPEGRTIYQCPPTEHELRNQLERSFKRLAWQAHNADEYGALVDLGNAIRPKTLS